MSSPPGGHRDHLALVVSQLASGAGSLLLLLLTARLLGAEGRGEFAFFLLWPMLGSYVLALGLPGANLRLAAEDPRRSAQLAGNTIVVAVITGTIAALPLALGPPEWLVGPMTTEQAWIAWAATELMIVFQGLTWLQMGLGGFVAASILRGVFPALAAAAFGLVVLFGGSSAQSVTVAALAFAASVACVTGWVILAIVRDHGRLRTDRALLATSVSFAVRYQGGLVAQLVTYRADQWVLGLSQPIASLGSYSVAASVSEVATYGASARGMTRFRDSAAGVRSSARAVVQWVLISTVVSAAAVAVTALVAIPLIFGREFDDAVTLTLLLLPGALGLGLTRVCGNDLAGRGQPGLVSAVALVQAVLMAPAFIIFIPLHGADAAALISSVGYLLGGAATALLLVRVSRSQVPTPAVPPG